MSSESVARNPRVAQAGRFGALAFAALVALLVTTVAVFGLVPRYEVAGPELVPQQPFTPDLAGWRMHGPWANVTVTDEGWVVLRNDDPDASVRLSLALPRAPGLDFVQVRGVFAARDVVPGQVAWYDARVVLASIDRDGNGLWQRPNTVFASASASPPVERGRIFRLTDAVASLVVSFGLAQATGEIEVRALSVRPVRERALFHGLTAALAAAWLVWLLALGGQLVRGTGTLWRAGLLALAALPVVVSLMLPGEWRTAIVEVARTTTAGLPIEPDDLAHALMFAGLAVVLRVARPRDPAAAQIFGLMAFAGISEVLQLFAVERGPSLLDWSFDAAGILFGFAIASLVRRLALS